jgi:hypothetical protein
MKRATPEEIERFNSKWTAVGDCHVWQGYKDKDGYGVLTFRRASRRAARVAMFLAGRPIPPGKLANHTCRNRACVNPQHIEPVTKRQNSLKDSTSVGYLNSQKTHCKKGHAYDRKYGKQRYCSICESVKSKRLRAKWKIEGIDRI